MDQGPFGLHLTTNLDLDDLDARVRAELEREGFTVLTDLDLGAALHELGASAEIPAVRLLGACHAEITARALEVWRGFAMVALCEIVMYDAGAHRVVQAFGPMELDQVRRSVPIEPLAREMQAHLERGLRAVAS